MSFFFPQDLHRGQQQPSSASSQQERLEQEQLEKNRLQRERLFEASLAKMNKEQRKKAQKQKRMDARNSKRILQAAKLEQHYRVLGLRNWTINLGPLFNVTQRDIKKAFYKMAKLVHPDKNVDGRAEEAFIQLERSAAILLDEAKRKQYNERVTRENKMKREEQMQLVMDSIDFLCRRSKVIVSVMYHVFKPFSTPILILGALAI